MHLWESGSSYSGHQKNFVARSSAGVGDGMSFGDGDTDMWTFFPFTVIKTVIINLRAQVDTLAMALSSPLAA